MRMRDEQRMAVTAPERNEGERHARRGLPFRRRERAAPLPNARLGHGDGEIDSVARADHRASRAGRRVYDRLDNFLAAFPARDEETPRQPVALAWAKAIHAGADPAELIRAARAYAAAVAGRERRFIVSAVRWLSEGRWRASGPPQAAAEPSAPPGVWIAAGGPGWSDWSAWWRETRGKSPPLDARGGWRFPAERPPEAAQLAA
jgi:hypothetical protein